MEKRKMNCKTKKIKELLENGAWIEAVDEFRKESKNTTHLKEAMQLSIQVTNYRRSEIEGQPDSLMENDIKEKLRTTLNAIETDMVADASETDYIYSDDDDDDD